MILSVFYSLEINVIDTLYRIEPHWSRSQLQFKNFSYLMTVYTTLPYTSTTAIDTSVYDQVMELWREAREDRKQSDIRGMMPKSPKKFKFTNKITKDSNHQQLNVATTSKDTTTPAIIQLDADGWEIMPPEADLQPKSSNGLVGIAINAARREWWNTLSSSSPPITSTSNPTTLLPLHRPFVTRSPPFIASLPPQQMKPTSVIDSSWELIDPNPDIYSLFMLFNSTYFWDKLGAVTVEWSSRMTSCAGLCYFHSSRQSSECRIKLSLPLLKLRPRKDLVETLLHEMIHAYLFLESGRGAVVDRDGHGPNFQQHMHRINRVSGAHITIYHTFYDEVRHYKQHWWQCNGPCRHRAPFFGLVKRVMNRAPAPCDRWWSEHAATCTGVFLKVREPPKSEKENRKHKASSTTTTLNF